MASINRDPEVTRFLNRPADEAAVEGFFALVTEHWSAHGFGFWAVEASQPTAPGRFIGFVGVAYPTFLPAVADRPELGWRLSRDTWGHGYATEAAIAARDDAFARLDLPELISIIRPDTPLVGLIAVTRELRRTQRRARGSLALDQSGSGKFQL